MYGRTESVGKSLTGKNANYKVDIRYATRINSYILSSIGIWPAMLQGVGRFLPIIMIILGNVAMCFAIIPCIFHTIYEERDVHTKMKLIGLLSISITASIKYCALTLRRSTIMRCVKHVEEDWNLVESRLDREAMLKYGKVGRILTITCASFLYSGGLIYHAILPFLPSPDYGQSEGYNRTIRNLVYPTYNGFFDSQRNYVYELVYAAQFFCEYVVYSITAGGCSLAAVFATHACGQVEIIISRLKDLVDGEIFGDSSNVAVRLKSIIKRHLRVLGFASMVETILQEVCLVEFVGSTFMICLVEYYCITDWKESNAKGFTTYILFFISLTFNIFILCYIGELLMEKTSHIGETCFMVDWYRLPINTSRGLILIMAMSINPVKITAGRMVDLSISTFGNVLKTSVVYLNFLRTAILK